MSVGAEMTELIYSKNIKHIFHTDVPVVGEPTGFTAPWHRHAMELELSFRSVPPWAVWLRPG